MRIVAVLVALLIVVPTVEIAVILTVGNWIGAGWTVALLLVSALLGGWLLRREGRRAYLGLRDALAAGRTPATEAAEGAFLLLGGLMMLLPGFVTDMVGLALVVRPVRAFAARVLIRRFARRLPPQVANDVFGPMQVRSRRGRARPATPPRPDRGARDGATPAHRTDGAPRVIEGDVER